MVKKFLVNVWLKSENRCNKPMKRYWTGRSKEDIIKKNPNLDFEFLEG